MKKKTIACPFCETEMTAIECVDILCPNCKQNIILEKEISNNIEDNLYILSSSMIEKSRAVADIAEAYFREKKFEDAYKIAEEAKKLNYENARAHFIMISSKICLINEIENKSSIKKYQIEEIKKLFTSAASSIKNKIELQVIEKIYQEFIVEYGTIVNENEDKNSNINEVKNIEQKNTETVRKAMSKPKKNVKKKKKTSIITRKECFDEPEPIAFPGFSEIKIISNIGSDTCE